MEEMSIIDQLQKEIEEARLNSNQNALARQQYETFMNNEEKSMVKEQLDLSDHITRLDYLLKGYSLKPDKDGNLVWTAPVSKDMEVFSDYGIQLIMNTVCFYLNQNTLLSNYSLEEIKYKMKNFTRELIFSIFMNYEKVFLYPTVEEAIQELKSKLKKRATVTQYAYQLQGKEIDEKAIYKEKLKEIEATIEQEIEKIRQNLIKEKLKRFPLLIRVVQDTVHSTYQRAMNGQERASLRLHMSVSESRGNGNLQPPKHGGMLPWSKK